MCYISVNMTGAVDHKRCIRGQHKDKEQREQPDDESRSRGMSARAAKRTIPTDLVSACVAAFNIE